MKFTIGNFLVQEIRFGANTSYKKGLLTINKSEALAVVCEDDHITEADLYLVHPGDDVRLLPVKDAVEPRIKLDGAPLFPGVTGQMVQCGEGITHALKGCSVVVVGQQWGGYQDGVIDMGGEGAKYTYFSQLHNIVLVADTDEAFEQKELQKKNSALRRAGLRLAEYIGSAVKTMEPEKMEQYEMVPVADRVIPLPKIALVLQVQSQMEKPGYNTLCYGWDCNHMVPTFINPNEILDGAMVSGSFMPSSSKWSTYDFQNFPMIKRLYQEHGKTLNFIGVILSNLNVESDQKERSTLFVVNMAKTLGIDAAIVAEEGYGNPDTDFTSCLVALEDAGIKTVGLTNECTGKDGRSQPLVYMHEKADAIVSCGNVSELIELPPAKIVLGNLQALARDGMSGGWADDELLGPSVRPDGSIIMENNAMFCGDQVVGWSTKTVKEF
ncbi:glycine/sarcosine/betaine reductase component B subunit [Desulfogranum marinum]|uniref:glycine/sarcosine/betaine reductase component B subunit n=1 Tax=Desulfogranum marinum TaxID=453220 RepID=UPI0019638638|nr:glycine/sarcosine/betaine reductase component B subunit [Desulfogranum marinum]MBM9511267.1 glycine/sarcosine/betaine reductase component B subunit [Desulfogranum marinum]